MSDKRKKPALSPKELDNVELALIKAMCSAGDTGLRPHVLEAALRRRLFQLIQKGVTDPEELKDAALRSVYMSRPV